MKRFNSNERRVRWICSDKGFIMNFCGYVKGTQGAHDKKWFNNYKKRKLTGKL